MLERCVRLDSAYTPAYLLLARLYQGQEGRGPAVGRLLRHVARLQPNSPDHLVELAAWLHEQGEKEFALPNDAHTTLPRHCVARIYSFVSVAHNAVELRLSVLFHHSYVSLRVNCI
jgi:hypothetical protein